MLKARHALTPGIIAAACLLAFAATAKTKVSGTTTADGKMAEAPPKKILVLTVASDPVSRAAFEDVIAGELSLRGAVAVASHLSFPELPKERGPFEAQMAKEGFDALTITRLVGSDIKVKVQEGHESYATTYQGSDWWGTYWYTYEKVFVPGYLKTETKVHALTELWRRTEAGGRKVWSGTSETMDPQSAEQAAQEVGSAVAKALAKAKLI